MVDFVIVVLDARAPLSSANDYLIKIFTQKPKIFILNKEDLADKNDLTFWEKYYTKENVRCISLNSKINLKNKLNDHLTYLTEAKRQKNLKRGIKNSLFKGIIVGVPNVGKSTIINALSGSKKTQAANKPGVTRNVNWIKISNSYWLMDTPGIMTPRFENKEESIKLALIGCIPYDILPKDEIVNYGLDFLKEYYTKDLLAYLNETKEIEEAKNLNNDDIIAIIARKFIPLLKDGVLNKEAAKTKFLNDFRNSDIVKFTIDRKEKIA